MPIFRSVVRISHSTLGGTGTNTWHARTISEALPGVGVDLDDLAEILATFYGDLADTLLDGATFVHDGIWQQVGHDEEDDPITAEGTGFTVTGTSTGDALPTATCLCVGWRTASGGRRGRGRTFLGPLSTQWTSGADGTPWANNLIAARNAADALVDSSDSFGNGAFGVFSRGEHTVPASPQLRDFVSAQIRDEFAVLRSRRD